ncbi:hypothetical protein DFH27DRAFT_617388 [Peziza echinospora]|nr:hypothetical protein DFH27DRAFT_617388 [Peziza echinospora]
MLLPLPPLALLAPLSPPLLFSLLLSPSQGQEAGVHLAIECVDDGFHLCRKIVGGNNACRLHVCRQILGGISTLLAPAFSPSPAPPPSVPSQQPTAQPPPPPTPCAGGPCLWTALLEGGAPCKRFPAILLYHQISTRTVQQQPTTSTPGSIEANCVEVEDVEWVVKEEKEEGGEGRRRRRVMKGCQVAASALCLPSWEEGQSCGY